ncbi:MAG TPA: acyl-CoA dehydrogenase family protein [Solirubrobacteraceae bacterium]|nr:acyl-CoA dehydrogenase family protein [Solirubrobacteraceae bacterium]
MLTTPDLFEDLGHALATDYFFLREQLTEQQLDVLRRVRVFVDDEVLPVIGGYWERAEMPWPLIRRLGELGIVGEDIRGYGCPGLDPIASGLVHMELNRGDGSLGTFLGVQAGLAMQSIAMLGSEEQKRRWLPGMARLEQLGAFALTEPDHGSDSVSLSTSARSVDGGYLLDGAKRWIGCGSLADVLVVWARNEDGRVNGFLVEKGAPGYEAEVIEGKGSLRAIWQAQIALDDVFVPEENRLPGANSFKDTARVLAGTRSTCAWAALGHAVAAYDTALTYVKRREQFGRPLASFQIIQQRLVNMLAEVTAMQLYCLQIGRLAERGQLSDTIAGLAKLNNTRKARQVCAEARDMLGGNGILLDNHVIRHMTDVEAIHTYEGTETMQSLIVGRDITGVGAFA